MIKLTVTVADGVISDVTVDEHAETDGIYGDAETAVVESVKERPLQTVLTQHQVLQYPQKL